jgi:hypothetical protein
MHVWSEELEKGSDDTIRLDQSQGHYSSAKSADLSALLGEVQLAHELRRRSVYPTNALEVLVKVYKIIETTTRKYNYI